MDLVPFVPSRWRVASLPSSGGSEAGVERKSMTKFLHDRAVTAEAFTIGDVESEGLKTVRLAPDGLVESKTGQFIIDEEGAGLIVRAFEEHGTPVPIDCEHQTMGGQYSSPSGRAPAVGWIHKIWREAGRGLMALVEWTEDATKLIRSGGYRYISPVVMVRQDDGRAIELHSAGLTNKPAIPRMEALAASDRFSGYELQVMGMIEDWPTKKRLRGMPEPRDRIQLTPTEIAVKIREALGMDWRVGLEEVFIEALDRIKGNQEPFLEEDDARLRMPPLQLAGMIRDALGMEKETGLEDVLHAALVKIAGKDGKTQIAGKDTGDMPNNELKEVLGKIKELLSMEGDVRVLDLLKAARDKLATLLGEDEDEDGDTEVASSVRELLGLPADAGKSEVIVAMTTRDTTGSRAELVTMKEAEREKYAKQRVDHFIKINVINPNRKQSVEAAMELAKEKPDRFEALMAGTKPYVPHGKTQAPDHGAFQRDRIIASAARQHRDEPSLQKTCTVRAFVNNALREESLGSLSKEEAGRLPADG